MFETLTTLPARPPAQLRSARRRQRRRRRAESDDVALLVRRASPADDEVIARLGALEERALPAGERLVGERGGRVVAALEVASGRTVADPFEPTSALVELLGVRAAQVRR